MSFFYFQFYWIKIDDEYTVRILTVQFWKHNPYFFV